MKKKTPEIADDLHERTLDRMALHQESERFTLRGTPELQALIVGQFLGVRLRPVRIKTTKEIEPPAGFSGGTMTMTMEINGYECVDEESWQKAQEPGGLLEALGYTRQADGKWTLGDRKAP